VATIPQQQLHAKSKDIGSEVYSLRVVKGSQLRIVDNSTLLLASSS
jgi:hypothetical protein